MKASVVNMGIYMYVYMMLGLNGCVVGSVSNGKRNMAVTRGNELLELMREGGSLQASLFYLPLSNLASILTESFLSQIEWTFVCRTSFLCGNVGML